MKILAEIVLDSIGPNGVRITTFKITLPRFILPEFNTHRMISKNASSSRAIPVSKQIESVRNHPFVPLAFNKNAKGMQGGESLSKDDQLASEAEWLKARDAAVLSAEQFVKLGVSKQYANRVLEPFSWTTVVCTATDWANFFALRCHYMAQPEICELAMQMWALHDSNHPKQLKAGQWHLPFVDSDYDGQDMKDTAAHVAATGDDPTEIPLKRSVARCARVSYLNHDGTTSSVEQDLALYSRLLGSAPVHASPAEHQAQATNEAYLRSGNFRGWVQYRKTIPGENVLRFTGPILKA